MYIMIIARGYPTDKYKLNGIFELDQAKALVKAGHKVVYAAVDLRSIRRWRSWGIEKKEIEGVKIYCINIPLGRVSKKAERYIGKKGLLKLYAKILSEQGKPDILHSHFVDISCIAAAAKEKIQLPLVMTEHLSTMMQPSIDKGLYTRASGAYELADALITVSPALSDTIKKRFHKECLYIPNIVDTEQFSYEETEMVTGFTFVSTGGLIVRKRMDMTIRAFSRAFLTEDNISLAIFGEGAERDRLQQLIEQYHMEGRIKLMGLQERGAIAKYYKSSGCFVLASRAETFGVVYIEAMACGLPVIATACGGPEGFIHENNGVIVPVDDEDALVKAFRNVYENVNGYNRRDIATETRKIFGPQAVAASLTAVYERILSNR